MVGSPGDRGYDRDKALESLWVRIHAWNGTESYQLLWLKLVRAEVWRNVGRVSNWETYRGQRTVNFVVVVI